MSHPRIIGFDGWVLRIDSGELTRNGHRVRLQDQPLQILDALLAHPGEIVTREQLIARLWPKGVVDFDTGLNSAVRKLRVALQDVAETPRYIETIPRKGYRFIGALEMPSAAAPMPLPVLPPANDVPTEAITPVEPPAPSTGTAPRAGHPRSTKRHIYVAAAVLAASIAAVYFFVRHKETASVAAPPPSPTAEQPASGDTLAVLPFRASAATEDDELLAQSLTLLMRNRLAALKGLVVIAGSSTAGLTAGNLDLHRTSQKLNARYIVRGVAGRSGDQLHVKAELIDGSSDSPLWSDQIDRSVNDVGTVRENITAGVANALRIDIAPHDRDATPVNLDAYQLYVRGQQLMGENATPSAETALELFRRATILDPAFARAYLAFAQAELSLVLSDDLRAPEARQEISQALDHAIELKPDLGEVWIERARLATDPAEADNLYRKGLALSPNSSQGYWRYSQFLEEQYRKGESFDMIQRARQIDPLTPTLKLREAHLVMVTRSDVREHDRLIGELIEDYPRWTGGLYQWMHSRCEYHAEYADAIAIAERLAGPEFAEEVVNPELAGLYLEVDDPDAAADVVRQMGRATLLAVDIAQYRHQWRQAADLARKADAWREGWMAPEAEAIRDEAVASGDYASALKLIESKYAVATSGTTGLRMWNAGLGLVYAHTLVLAGETQRGRKLASAIIVQIESEQIGRVVNDWFGRSLGAAYVILGDNEKALQHLTASLEERADYARWWYTADYDPLYAGLRQDPRFQALARKAKRHREEQRTKLDEMRRKGEVPHRP